MRASNRHLLTIQDISCVGQCSGTVALPLVSACGVECSILPSAVLSTHTGYPFRSWTFRDLTADMKSILTEWEKHDIKFDAIYTGYVCASQIDPIIEIMHSRVCEGALRIVDPVMGDNGKRYAGFDSDFPSEMRRLCAEADYITPNLTEVSLLLGEEPVLAGYDERYVESMMDRLHRLGPKNVIVTGVSFEKGRLGLAVSDGRSVSYDFNDYVDALSHGTGDMFASIFSGALLRGVSPLDAASLAADIVCESLLSTPKDHQYGPAFEKAIPSLVNGIDRLTRS